MAVKIFSAAANGFDAQLIEVEVEATHGLRCFDIVGLADKSVAESRERVGAAIKNSKFTPPSAQSKRVLVNLAPADVKKEGSFYDLPIALGFLLQTGQIKFDPQDKVIIGELSLNGQTKPNRGILGICLSIQNHDCFKEIIVPKDNAQEAALAFVNKPNVIKIIGVASLDEATKYLQGKINIEPTTVNVDALNQDNCSSIDIGWIKGQEFAKRALEICAAGGHNILMVGPPGGGKSLLAKALPSILPPLTLEEMIETTKIYSLAGMLPNGNPLIVQRPFRSPHHSASTSAIVGGGGASQPGEITLAHRGVLFLDEFPEFHRDVLESLRQPIEDGQITVARAKKRTTFPCKFMLVAAANPTPGGFFEDDGQNYFSASQVAKYKRKLSGPIVDRIDLYVELPAIKYEKLIEESQDRQSEKIRAKVSNARLLQQQRFAGQGIFTNSEMSLPQIKKFCATDAQAEEILKNFVNSGRLSARGYHRILKVARTIADLDQSQNIKTEHVSEALMYRQTQES